MKIMDITPGKGVLVKTDGDVTEIGTTIDELQSAVGGFVERIVIDGGRAMWVNEEGKMSRFDWNPTAQRLFDMSYGSGVDVIVGDVVITLDTE